MPLRATALTRPSRTHEIGALGEPQHRLDEPGVGQACGAAGGLDGQAGVDGIGRVVGRERVGERGGPLHGDLRGDQPPRGGGPERVQIGDGHAHRAQVEPSHQPAAAHLAARVRQAGHLGQRGGPGRRRAPPPQLGGSHVEHDEPGRDHPAAGVPQHRAVADPQRERAAQPQPDGVGAQRSHPHGRRHRPDVQHQLLGQRVGIHPDSGAHREPDEAAVQGRDGEPGVRLEQRVAAGDGVAGHAAQVDRDPRHPADPRHVGAEALQPPHRDPAAADGGGELQLVVHLDPARAERAGDDRARAADRERAVDPQPHVGGVVGRGQPLDQRLQRGPQLAMPAPVAADTATASIPASGVSASRSRASSTASSGSIRSLRVTTSRPRRTPSATNASTCSPVCGIQPSSAATTSSTAGTGPTPASIVVTNRSWPGTSTNATGPDGRSVQANPRSMVMPRRFSSA